MTRTYIARPPHQVWMGFACCFSWESSFWKQHHAKLLKVGHSYPHHNNRNDVNIYIYIYKKETTDWTTLSCPIKSQVLHYVPFYSISRMSRPDKKRSKKKSIASLPKLKKVTLSRNNSTHWRHKSFFFDWAGASNVNFGKISVRKTIWNLGKGKSWCLVVIWRKRSAFDLNFTSRFEI